MWLLSNSSTEHGQATGRSGFGDGERRLGQPLSVGTPSNVPNISMWSMRAAYGEKNNRKQNLNTQPSKTGRRVLRIAPWRW